MPDSLFAAMDRLAEYIKERQLAANREHWDRYVLRKPGIRRVNFGSEDLVHHVQLFREAARELELHPDCLAPREARLWRAIVSFFDIHRAPTALLNDLDSVLRKLETTGPSPVSVPSRTMNGHLDCWRKVRNEEERRRAWDVSITSNPDQKAPFARLIRLRNEVAQALGYPDFHEYRLRADGWDPAAFHGMLATLDQATQAPYSRARGHVDAQLARLWKRPIPEGACWLYGEPWVQSAPEFLPGHPSKWILRDRDSLVRFTLSGLGWFSRIYQLRQQKRETFFPTAFCLHMNRGADIRIAANLGPDLQSLQLLLHEAGHAAWFAHLEPGLPFLLRTPAHPLLSEGFSMLMQRLPFIPSWVRATRSGRIRDFRKKEPEFRRADWIDRLFFARWSLALIRFEHRLYTCPEHDYQSSYWEMVRLYQGFEPPPGRGDRVDYLSKHHLLTHPVHYHHYLFGMCFASQLSRRLATLQGHDTDPLELDLTGRSSVLGLPTTDSLAVGEFLRTRLFAPGADVDDPFAFAAEVCAGTFSPDSFIEDLARLETMFRI